MPPGYEWAYVYSPLTVRATLDWLASHKSIAVPTDSRQLVELATHPEHLSRIAERWGRPWQSLAAKTLGVSLAQVQRAQGALIDAALGYEEALVSEREPTRLGEGQVMVRLTEAVPSPFTGDLIEELPVPWRWIRNVPVGTEGAVTGSDVHVGDVALTYTKLGLRRPDA
jgi:hypothetical protein